MLCLLTGRQVENDADRGRVVDDVRALVQVVHVIPAVIATVTKHQLQHQVLWESQKKTARKSERSTPWQLRRSETAAGRSGASSFDYSIIRVPWEAVWTERTVSSSEIMWIRRQHLSIFCSSDRDKTASVYRKFTICTYLQVCCDWKSTWGAYYLDGSLLFANIVGLQLLRLRQRSADRRPETDSWDKRAAAELLIMQMTMMMMVMTIIIISHCLLLWWKYSTNICSYVHTNRWCFIPTGRKIHVSVLWGAKILEDEIFLIFLIF